MTLVFLISSIVLIIASQLVGISDNPPGILMIGIGVLLFYYSFLHSWKTSRNFVRLIYASLGIVLLLFLVIGIILSPLLFIHNFKMNHSVGWSLFIVLVIGFPFMLAGIFFIRNHFKMLKRI